MGWGSTSSSGGNGTSTEKVVPGEIPEGRVRVNGPFGPCTIICWPGTPSAGIWTCTVGGADGCVPFTATIAFVRVGETATAPLLVVVYPVRLNPPLEAVAMAPLLKILSPV